MAVGIGVGAWCGALVWGQPKAAESSCAINITAVLPLARHQHDRRDL